MSRDFQQTHENLLACAKEHFLENGFERASIREICKAAHVTNGAFYNHFEDKEALFGALVEPVVQAVSEMYSDYRIHLRTFRCIQIAADAVCRHKIYFFSG